MPDLTFVNSQKSEKLRYKSTRKEVGDGWFVEHGFLISPQLLSEAPPQIQVVFPKTFAYEPVEPTGYATDWARVEAEFWAELDHYLPEARKMHDKVVVDVGRIGTVASSYWDCSHYYLRADRSLADLAGMIINHVMYEKRSELGVTWTKREALMDFIMTRPAMKKLFPEFEPIYSQLLQVPAKIRRASEEYVLSLGFVMAEKELSVQGGKILVKNQVASHNFGKKEQILLKLLIQRKNELVTYDELADQIWGEGEFKSFWALAKLVERVRKSMSDVGLDPKRLESVRGQGYILN